MSVRYQYDIKQTSDENKEKYQQGIISQSNDKFSEVKSWKLSINQQGDSVMKSWEWKG